jgi:hypothetical protein
MILSHSESPFAIDFLAVGWSLLVQYFTHPLVYTRRFPEGTAHALFSARFRILPGIVFHR